MPVGIAVMKPTNTHIGVTYHWIKSPSGEYVIWLWTDSDFGYGWIPFGWTGTTGVLVPSSVPSGWEYVSYVSMPVGG